MNPTSRLELHQISSAMICFNKSVQIVEDTPHHCRLRVKLQHHSMAKLYGKFFPLRDYHDYVLEGLALVFFRQFQKHPVSMKDAVQRLQNEHQLSYFEACTLLRNYTGQLMRCGIAVTEISG